MTTFPEKISGAYRYLNEPIQNPITRWLAYWFKTEFAPNMPRKWKRVLYIASIIALTSFTDKPDFILFEKINNLLKMTYKGQSYWIPKFMRNMIWKSILKEQIILDDKVIDVTNLDVCEINEKELEQICNFFIRKTPEWIVYAPTSFIKNDLMQCLTELFNKRFNSCLI